MTKPVIKDGKVFMPDELPEEEKVDPASEETPEEKPEEKPETVPEEKPEEKPDISPPPLETDEETEQREEFIQTRYQNWRERLKKYNPILAAKIDSEIKAGELPVDEPEIEDTEEKTLMEMTPGELKKVLREANRESLMQLKAEGEYGNELDAAVDDLGEVAKRYGITQEERKAILSKVGDMFHDDWRAQPGGPTRFVMVAHEVMHNLYLSKLLTQRTTTASADAEDRTRAAILAGQPEAAPPGQRGEPTEKQQLLNEMKAVKPQSSARLLDSERK